MVDFEQELTDPERMSERVAFYEQLSAEEQAAAGVCERVLTGPSRWWGKALDQVGGAYTAGMVRVLIARAEKVVARTPAEALDLAEIALHIAERIDFDCYPYDHIVKLRGQALREKAYVLSFMGRHREARSTAELAALLLAQIPIAPLELARLDLVRSDIARRMEKYTEAAELARKAGETFLAFGSRDSWLKARQYEALALFEPGQYAEAREVLRLCEAYFERLDLQSRATLLHNLGMCALELGDPEEAEHRFSRSAVLLEELGYHIWSAKSRYWSAKALIVAGRYGEAIPVLEQSWRQLEKLGATGDAVLPALLLAEAFLIVGRKNEVPAICRQLLERCTQESMPTYATTALAFLREAVANGNVSPSLVRDIHDYMRDSGRKAARFAS